MKQETASAIDPVKSAAEVCNAVVVFRNDDISAVSDVAHERRVASIFERYGVPQTLAVIPLTCPDDEYHQAHTSKQYPLDDNPEVVKFVLEYAGNSGSEIALHGCTHRPNKFSVPSRREYTEFRGLSVAEQERKIAHGLEVFVRSFGVRPITFVPPWNRLDDNTVLACRNMGCSIISARPYLRCVEGITAVGMNCDIRTLPERLAKADPNAGRALLVVCYHSRTIRTPAEFAALENAVRLASEMPGCRTMTIEQVVSSQPLLVQEVNEAAMNVSPQEEMYGTPRARAAIYRGLLRSVGRPSVVERMYASAGQEYRAGRYGNSRVMTPAIERHCRRLILTARLAVAGAGAVVGAVAALARPGEAPRPSAYLAVISLTALAGLLCRWVSTAVETRKEAGVATGLLVGSTFGGMLLTDLLFLL